MAGIKYGILLVSELNEIDKNIYESIYTILGPAKETSHVLHILDDKDIIMEKIISWSDGDNVNVILIINYNSSDNNIIEALRKTTINVDSTLARLLSKIESHIKSIFSRGVCKMRNQTVILNLPGSNEIMTSLKKIIYVMQRMFYVARRKDEQSSSDNDPTEKEVEIAVKRCKITSDSELSATDQIYMVENIVKVENEFPMISVKIAISRLRKETRMYFMNLNNRDIVNLNDANGRVLCETVFSKCDVPSFRTAIKHGYAVLADEGEGVRMVVKTSAQTSLKPGTCVWVKTGAPIPDGATAVVQVRDTRRLLKTSNTDGDKAIDETKIKIIIKPEINQNIKAIGSEISKGKIIANLYTRLSPAEIGILAASGCKEVKVAKRLTIGVLSIGDELEEPGNPLKPGYTYDSNRITLISLLKNKGFQPLDFGIVLDNLSSITHKIKEALQKVDLLVTTGSVGERDLMKEILKREFNADIHFGHVNVKPGKSTTFATCWFENKKKYFLCLSRNPISVPITAHLFLLPLVDEMNCNFYAQPVTIPACSKQKYVLHTRPRYVWTVLQWTEEENFARAFSKENHATNRLLSCKGANALLMLPQQTEDEKVLPDSFVPAILVNCPQKLDIK